MWQYRARVVDHEPPAGDPSTITLAVEADLGFGVSQRFNARLTCPAPLHRVDFPVPDTISIRVLTWLLECEAAVDDTPHEVWPFVVDVDRDADGWVVDLRRMIDGDDEAVGLDPVSLGAHLAECARGAA